MFIAIINIVVEFSDGTQAWIIYHGMQSRDGGWGNRTARVQQYFWNPDHSPAFPRPTSLGTPLETPSGQP